jgi:CubicO group peptidase (beta-lactamase class C family)
MRRNIPPATGDRDLASELTRLARRGWRQVAAASIDLNGAIPVRLAFINAGSGTRFELGSVTKALTGMLLACAVERAELTMDTTVGESLSNLTDSPVATVSVRELCTHTSGLPRLPRDPHTLIRGIQFAMLGLDPYRGATASEVIALAGRQDLRHRGQPAYSNLGAALLGQLLAERAGTDFSTLLRTRIFIPLGVPAASVATRRQKAEPGWSPAGLPRMPWVMDGYAPAGGVVATIEDLARLGVALLTRTASGSSSMDPIPGAVTSRPARRSGMFWIIDSLPDGNVITWHNGATGGYSAFFAIFPQTQQAVAALANVARPSDLQQVALGLAAGGSHTIGRRNGPA